MIIRLSIGTGSWYILGLLSLSSIDPPPGLAVNMVKYLFVGVGDLNSISLKVITTMPDLLILDSNSMLYAHTRTSDWTVTTLNWMSAIKSCEGSQF
jgi:hypothetical protein